MHAPYCGAGAQPTRIPEEQKLLDSSLQVSWTSDFGAVGVCHAAAQHRDNSPLVVFRHVIATDNKRFSTVSVDNVTLLTRPPTILYELTSIGTVDTDRRFCDVKLLKMRI